MKALRLICALGFLAVPAARADIMQSDVPAPESTLWSSSNLLGSTLAAALGLGGHVLPAHPCKITAVSVNVSIVSGGGAGNTVITLTDGTNTCTATLACATTSATGAYRIVTANGAGSGCAYPANAKIVASVTTAGCTVTQPTITNLEVIGQF